MYDSRISRSPVQLLGAVVAALVGCSGAARPAHTDTIEDLRFAVASAPRDRAARARLARALDSAGAVGGAVREFERLERSHGLDSSDRHRLGELLAARGRARLALADTGAHTDLDRAAALGSDDRRARAGAHLLAVLDSFRQGDDEGLARARKLIARVRELSADDPIASALASEDADRDQQIAVAAWLAAGGARRAALDRYRRLVEDGLADREQLAVWLTLHDWWHGDSRTPGAAGLRRAQAAGVEVCLPGIPLVGSHCEGAFADDSQAEQETATDLDLGRQLAHEWGRADLADPLSAVVGAYRRDPAQADRRARALSNDYLCAGQTAPLLAELFHRLGDRERADDWAQELLASSPDHYAYLLVAAITAAHAGDVDRAEVLFTRGAAASGDSGAAMLMAARVYLEAGHALAAVAAARRAQQLSASGRDTDVRAVLGRAHALMGRDSPSGVAEPAGDDRLFGPLRPALAGAISWRPVRPRVPPRQTPGRRSSPDEHPGSATSGEEVRP